MPFKLSPLFAVKKGNAKSEIYSATLPMPTGVPLFHPIPKNFRLSVAIQIGDERSARQLGDFRPFFGIESVFAVGQSPDGASPDGGTFPKTPSQRSEREQMRMEAMPKDLAGRDEEALPLQVQRGSGEQETLPVLRHSQRL
jgi:hypothetical protein